MNKKLLTAVLLLLLPLFLTACTIQDIPVIGGLFRGEETPVEEAKTVINVWGVWENPEVMDAMAAKYEEQNPNIDIVYDDRSVLSPAEYRESVFSRIGEGSFDVVRIHNTWPSFLKGSLAPMPQDLMSPEQYREKFYPVAYTSGVLDGSIYSVPLYHDGLVLVYNKDHFTEINQDEPPTSWEEFRKLALELTIRDEEGNPVRGGAAIGTVDNIDFSTDILGLMFAQADVKIPDDFEKLRAQDALKFYTNFVTEDKVWNNTFPEAAAAFAQERTSMIFIPSWNLLDIIKVRPDLNVGVAPVPQALPKNPQSWASFWMEAVPASSNNTEEAWKFINFMAQEEQQLALFSEASKYRQFGAPYSLRSLASQVSEDSFIYPVLQTAEYAKTGVIVSRAGNDRIVDIMKNAVNYTFNPEKRDENPALNALKSAKAAMYNQ